MSSSAPASKSPAILVTRRLPDNVRSRLARDYSADLNEDDGVLSRDELLRRARDADALLICPTEKMSAEVIAALPERVKMVSCFSVGVDHVDLAAAAERGLIVTNTPDVLSDATAEIAILLMLGAARRAGEGERLVRADRWHTWSPTFHLGTEITGKRLGLVGMGRIGQITARRARGFDMEIHYHNRRPLDAELAGDAVYHESLEEMLPLCDVLSIHCPLTAETTGLLNAERLALLPDGAIVVNTARGGVVDDEALIAALKSGKLAAAGLDVFNNEPNIHPGYRELENAFLLPHLGSATVETRDAMGFRAVDNLDAFFAGKEPPDRVA
ncbi:lactate dehydrogenase-like 2-hydroxyacid dehydrogenase [Rhodobium orientis]|uniref:D-glycerate dehydrogenase n=1 Tax=Rhodobium orientis TaxID=34017 RepID=A0A327JLR5_9HYPH|nr:D-glycerate dehydrogenase [Rhodobium orientis]MBB4305143.1 lactate dehydrogenase-like 2-hydroxyacid dehydrogenase [Rhodobium orientis]MBK5950917.1 D-glycerate dehydrogenase [Rhodobium orientis]RAI27031.1 D-glycerate dehydrogenase [Rhodobium orientis]